MRGSVRITVAISNAPKRVRNREADQAMPSTAVRMFDLAIIGGGINGCGIARDKDRAA